MNFHSMIAILANDGPTGTAAGLAIAGVSLLVVPFTWRALTTILRSEDVFQRWVQREGFRVIRREVPIFPDRRCPFPINRYRIVYRVTVEDQSQHQRSGWVCLGWWYMVGFSERIEVRWDD